MKLPTVVFVGWVLVLNLQAEDPSAPAVPSEFQVLSRTVTKEMAVEPAPLPGMTPVTKERTVTVDLVADPQLPAPPPAPAVDPNDPAVKARLAAFRAAYQPTRMIHFSATTYDFTLTRLIWRSRERPNEEITAWSNIPFEYIRGLGTQVIKDRKYMLFLGYGVENTVNLKRLAARRGVPYVAPTLPELPDLATSGPAFIMIAGDPTGTPELDFLTGLHEIYPAEASRLKAAYEAREAARIAHEAYLRAHPPEPEDVHVRFWQSDRPTTAAAEGGRP